MKQDKIQQTITLLSRLYFDGLTTLEQERQLRRLLMDNPGIRTSEAEEARAVMSAIAVSHRPAKQRRRLLPSFGFAAGTAAAVALLFVFITPTAAASGNDSCYSRTATAVIDNPEQVKAMALADLKAVGAAASEVKSAVQADITTISSTLSQSENL